MLFEHSLEIGRIRINMATEAEHRRRVFLGKVKGETPRKEVFFSRDEPPLSVGNATPQRLENLGLPLKSSLSAKSTPAPPVSGPTNNTPEKMTAAPMRVPDRPTTSRGKAHPSPDEFTNYIQTSPQSKVEFERGISTVMSFSDSKSGEDGFYPYTSDSSASPSASGGDAFSTDNVNGGDDDQGEVTNPFSGDIWGDSFGFRSSFDPTDLQVDDVDGEVVYGTTQRVTNEQLEALRGCWLFGIALQV